MGGREGLVGGAWEGDSTALGLGHFGTVYCFVYSFCVFECTFVMCTNKVLNCHDMTGVLLTLAAGAGATESVVPRTTTGLAVESRLQVLSTEGGNLQMTGVTL